MTDKDVSLPVISEQEFSRLSKMTVKEKAVYLLRKRIEELEEEIAAIKKSSKEDKQSHEWLLDQNRKSLKKATPLWQRVHPEAKDTYPGISTVIDWLLDERARLIKENKAYRAQLGLTIPKKNARR